MPKALIVDDVEVSRYILRGHLESGGYTVDEAGNAEQTLAALQKSRYDVIILDWYLNDKTAEDLVQAIRKASSVQPKIIVLSGVATDEEIPEIRKLGIDAFVSKPTTKDKIHKVLEQVKKA